LSNLASITQQLELEIFRPVLTYDKQEIIDVAKEIGTFEISSGPEICNLLGPKNPATKSDVSKIKEELMKIDMALLEKAVQEAEVLQF
ncbi:tRNA 4-thiouridine(8) synthase ThiI, partial [archaeon]|nr:tRNA 4-thiouridine(8) synthase ThiI [archaeon]